MDVMSLELSSWVLFLVLVHYTAVWISLEIQMRFLLSLFPSLGIAVASLSVCLRPPPLPDHDRGPRREECKIRPSLHEEA